MNTQTALRDEARGALQVYQSQTGMSLRELSILTGFGYYSMRHLAAGANYAKDGQGIAQATLEFIKSHPAPERQAPGKLYATKATAQIEDILADCREGAWGTLYGPAGAQKTFTLECIAAQEGFAPEPGMVLVEIPSRVSACELLGMISQAVKAPYSQSGNGRHRAIIYTVQRRRTSLALVLDEAQRLYRCVDALEALRGLGDALPVRNGRAGLGMLVVGNEQITQLFEPRRGNYFEQWRSRIDQKEVRVLGPSISEAKDMVRGEVGDVMPADVLEEFISGRAGEDSGCVVFDPIAKKKYVSTRRLFNALRVLKKRMREN